MPEPRVSNIHPWSYWITLGKTNEELCWGQGAVPILLPLPVIFPVDTALTSQLENGASQETVGGGGDTAKRSSSSISAAPSHMVSAPELGSWNLLPHCYSSTPSLSPPPALHPAQPHTTTLWLKVSLALLLGSRGLREAIAAQAQIPDAWLWRCRESPHHTHAHPHTPYKDTQHALDWSWVVLSHTLKKFASPWPSPRKRKH